MPPASMEASTSTSTDRTFFSTVPCIRTSAISTTMRRHRVASLLFAWEKLLALPSLPVGLLAWIRPRRTALPSMGAPGTSSALHVQNQGFDQSVIRFRGSGKSIPQSIRSVAVPLPLSVRDSSFRLRRFERGFSSRLIGRLFPIKFPFFIGDRRAAT